MKKIPELFGTKHKVFSFELFPPKTEKGYESLLLTLEKLCALRPDFISCTYGAGGGSRDKTLEIVELIEKKYSVMGLAHLTCVLNTKDEIKTILEDTKRRGIKNILALRGDPPKENPDWQPTQQNFKYSSELCAFIKKNFGGYFGIGVAGFPEGHLLCRDRNQDAQYLKLKVVNGAEFVITQLFFDNKDYFEYVERLRKIDVKIPIVPGILPIVDYQNLLKFTALCGASIPDEIKKIFAPIQNDKEATLRAGIEFAVRQCRALLKGGAPGLHFYCLNKVNPTDEILKAVRD